MSTEAMSRAKELKAFPDMQRGVEDIKAAGFPGVHCGVDEIKVTDFLGVHYGWAI